MRLDTITSSSEPMREHVTPYVHNIDGEIQTWPPYSKYSRFRTVRIQRNATFYCIPPGYEKILHFMPYMVVTKSNIQPPCLNFTVYSSYMLPCQLYWLSELLIVVTGMGT